MVADLIPSLKDHGPRPRSRPSRAFARAAQSQWRFRDWGGSESGVRDRGGWVWARRAFARADFGCRTQLERRFLPAPGLGGNAIDESPADVAPHLWVASLVDSRRAR